MEQHPWVQLYGKLHPKCSSESAHAHRKGVGEADATHGCRVPIYKGGTGLDGGVFSLNSIRGVVFLGMASCRKACGNSS